MLEIRIDHQFSAAAVAAAKGAGRVGIRDAIPATGQHEHGQGNGWIAEFDVCDSEANLTNQPQRGCSNDQPISLYTSA